MNRFFSKLDLREIRIDPRSSRFPPAVDESEDGATSVSGDQPLGASADRGAPSFLEAPGTDWSDDEAVRTSATPDVSHRSSQDAADHLTATEPSDVLAAADDVLKVSARSRPSAVAGAIAGVVREVGRAEVQAIGAGATNQAVKAVAIARDYLHETGIDVICLPAFIDVTIGNEDRTAIRLVIEPR